MNRKYVAVSLVVIDLDDTDVRQFLQERLQLVFASQADECGSSIQVDVAIQGGEQYDVQESAGCAEVGVKDGVAVHGDHGQYAGAVDGHGGILLRGGRRDTDFWPICEAAKA
ncbi:hypothetical protein ABZV77_09920 [Streptomyces sp. NPDC004732]|uniref:hypothetical protein n=1 Tax=Streptomyces sp. NPDC004732 TaxID=3154290 RepID=UPI0033BC4535